MHKEGNSNRHFIFICWTWANTPLKYKIYYDSAKFETLAGTAPQSVGCGARYSDIPMFRLGRRKLIIFLLCESQRLAVNDHKQAGTNHTSHLNSINFNHLSANSFRDSSCRYINISIYIYLSIHLPKIQSKIRHQSFNNTCSYQISSTFPYQIL